MGKIKNILLDVDFDGFGLVNMDSNSQRFMYNGTKKHKHLMSRHENVTYSKKVFTGSGEDLDFKIKVSSECIRKNMFESELISQTANIVANDALLYSFVGSPMAVIRGYLFADKEETIKRSSPLNLTDAVQTCDAMPYLETCSRSGEKAKKTDEDDAAGTTYFFKENVGEIKYSSKGAIDLQELSFVSCDNVYGRFGFNPDKFSLLKQFMSLRMENFNSELGYHQLKTSIIDIPEYGFIFSNENKKFLVKEILMKILGLDISKKSSFFKTSGFRIKLVENPLVDTYNNKDGWITIKSEEDIDNLSIDFEEFYELVDLETAKLKRVKIEEELKDKISEAKAKKVASIKVKTPKEVKK